MLERVSRKDISIDRTLSKSYWTWRSNPALSVPTMLSSSLTVLAQAIFGIAIVGLLAVLERTEWMQEVVAATASLDLTRLGSLLTSPGFIWTTAAFLVPALVLTLVVTILALGHVYSAEFGSYWMALQGPHVGVSEVMVKFDERWREMAWTSLLSYVLTILPFAGGLALALVATYAGSGLIVGVAVIIGLAVGVAGTLVLSALLIYTPVVVMAEGLSGPRALSRSVFVSRRIFGSSVTYGVVYFFFTTAVTYATSLIPGGSLPVGSLASVGVLIIITPVLHLAKTDIFRQYSSAEPSPVEFRPSFSSDLGSLLRALWASFIRGLQELKSFAFEARNVPYHLLSAIAMVVGYFAGDFLAQNGLTKLIENLGYSSGNPINTESGEFRFGRTD